MAIILKQDIQELTLVKQKYVWGQYNILNFLVGAKGKPIYPILKHILTFVVHKCPLTDL